MVKKLGLLGRMFVGTTLTIASCLLSFGADKVPKEIVNIPRVENSPTVSNEATRTLSADLHNPLDGPAFESRAKLTNSAGQALGFYFDVNKNDPFFSRIGKLGARTIGELVIMELSHEGAHVAWSDNPRVSNVLNHKSPNTGLNKDNLHYFSAGLNQNGVNALHIYEDSCLGKNPANSVGYLANSLAGVYYLERDSKSTSDFKGMSKALMELGMNYSPNELRNRYVACALLDGNNALALASIANDVLGEKRINFPGSVQLGGNEFTIPSVSMYVTSEGPVYNVTSFVNPRGELPLQASLRVSETGIVETEAKFHDLVTGLEKITISPNLAVSTDGGINVGAGIKYVLPKEFSSNESRLAITLDLNANNGKGLRKSISNSPSVSGVLGIEYSFGRKSK